jgi:hypothetical protein
MSLPKQCEHWSDLKAAYRLLSNARADPHAMQRPHRTLTRASCVGQGVILAVEDKSEIDLTTREKITGLGQIGNGHGRGLIQHSTLAVRPGGELMGVLDQHWFARIDVPEGETRTQKLERWQESDVWADAIKRVGASPEGCRLVHVMDREGDCFPTIAACDAAKVGFVIRAARDRNVEDKSDKLFSWTRALPVIGAKTVEVRATPPSRNAPARRARKADLSIRVGEVTLDRPGLRPGRFEPRRVFVVYAWEEHPPAGEYVQQVEWLLVTSEPATDAADAERIMSWYANRWVIEEWHRVLKEGCKLEQSQLDEADDVRRLAAILSVVAVRMLQMRDLAGMNTAQGAAADPRADDPAALRNFVPKGWLLIVGKLAGQDPAELTPRTFWLTIAKKGGYPARRRDGRPGWKAIWRGWYDIALMVRGAELVLPDAEPRCG